MKMACVVMVILNLLLLLVASVRVLMLGPAGPLPPRPVVEVRVTAGGGPAAAAVDAAPAATKAAATTPKTTVAKTPAPAAKDSGKKDEIPGMENAVGVTSHETYDYDSKDADGAQQKGLDDAKAKMRKKFGPK